MIGKVTNVILGHNLALEDVLFPASGERVPSWNVAANNIADLKVVNANIPPSLPATPSHASAASHGLRNGPAPAPAQPVFDSPSVQRQAFVDPAILTFGRSPAPASRIAPPPPPPSEPASAPTPVRAPVPAPVPAAAPQVATSSPAPATPVKSIIAAAAAKLPTNTSPFIGHAPETTRQPTSAKPTKKLPQDFFADPAAEETADLDGAQQFDQNGAKRLRGGRGRKGRGSAAPIPAAPAATEAQTVKGPLSPNVSRSGRDMNATPVTNKKGWRSTPLLKEAAAPEHGSAKGKKKPKRTQRSAELHTAQNGWATEDATDIQDLGDFDFEANHAKFDKRSVFDQIRTEDTTADEDRLVSHNRLARPGTNGGKNLHPTENVLSPTLKPQYESPELGSESDADTELNFGSGQNSRRAMSRTSTKRPPRRSNSNVPEDGQHPLSASFTSTAFNRSMSSLRNANIQQASSTISTSPNPNRNRSPASTHSPLRSIEQMTISQRHAPHFRVRSTNQPCPVLHPDRLVQAEADAIANIKLSPDALTENAARGIAESVLSSALHAVPSRRSSKSNVLNNTTGSPKPVVAILAGNHLCGARAIASARHIYGRGFKVLISILEFSNASVWHPEVAKQIQSLQSLGRKAARIEGWRSTSGHIKRLDGPPAVIVDALLDGLKYSQVQSVEQQLETRDMIDWANRSRAGVVSVNIPSGFSAGDGTTSIVEGEPLAVRPEHVIALAAPSTGLLEAVKEGEGGQWHLGIIDIGVNVVLRDKEKMNFGSNWTAALDFSRGEV